MRIRHTFLAIIFLAASLAVAAEPLTTGNSGFLRTLQHTSKKRDVLGLEQSQAFSRSSMGLPGLGGVLGGGLFIHAGVFFPFKNYLDPYSYKNYKMGYDVEWGRYFKLVKVTKFSIGIRMTWLSGSYSTYSDSGTVTAISSSPLRVGAQAMFGLGKHAALTVFYNIGGQYSIEMGSGYNLSYVGLSHEASIGFNYRILAIGAGYRFGDLKNILNSDSMPIDKSGFSVSSLRIFAGIKL